MNDFFEARVVSGNWGRYRCRIQTCTRFGKPRWRYVIDREFAGITEVERRGLWRRSEQKARDDGEVNLDSFDSSNRPGEYL